MDLQQKNKLLYTRAGFGISLDDFKNPRPVSEVVASLFPKSSPGPLEIVTEQEWAVYNPAALRAMTDEAARKDKKIEYGKKYNEFNLLWMEAMVKTSFPLLEKMALFWQGHFATKIGDPYYEQLLLNDIRKNALGNFGDLLCLVSKSPAMMQFLNNRQNKKAHPNENFAREVMELFTMGRGHYTETDIKEAARAFTGWSYKDENGDFFFDAVQHDNDEKKFLGRTGNFDGNDILNILLQQKQTAVFITQKIYRFFVSEEKIDNKHVHALAGVFYNSNYDITALLKELFTSKWFYDDQVAGTKIKSPIEFLVTYQRTIPMSFKNPGVWISLQKILGQRLFAPPGVAGWPGGKDWIDSSRLVIRMRVSEAFFGTKELNLSAKEVDPEMMADMTKKTMAPPEAAHSFRLGQLDEVDWSGYVAFWKDYKKEELAAGLAAYLLPINIGPETLQQVQAFADNSSDEKYIRSMTILLMGLPEYQLC